nr:hypothetical protein [uncultured Schaedlerella sp.]
MRKPPKSAYEFSDDFEVTYEEDISSKYKVNPESDEDPRSGARAETITQPMPRVRNSRHYDLSIEDPDDGSDGYYDSRDDYDYEDDDYDRPGNGRRRGSRSDYREPVRPSHARRKRSRQTPIAAPIKKGGRTVYRISQTIFRNLSVILILAITGFMAYNFFRGSAPYGDIENAVVSQNYTLVLASYFAVAAFFILFELFSALWAMTRVRVYGETGYYKEDVGRGMFSFFFIYICSYGAFLVNNWIPERFESLQGIRGALDVFGSMHNVLFGLCAAGVISCLFRKYSL